MDQSQILFGAIDDKVLELEMMLEKAETTLNLVLNQYFQEGSKKQDIILGEHSRAGIFTEITSDILANMRNTVSEINGLLAKSDELEEKNHIAGNDAVLEVVK